MTKRNRFGFGFPGQCRRAIVRAGQLAVAGVLQAGVLAAGNDAFAQTPATQQKALSRYAKYAGAPIDQFQFWDLFQWELAGRDKVLVWTAVNQAYLITVRLPCNRLQWANSIGLTSQQAHIVSRKFDYVTAGDERCHITEIQPIDYKAMKEAGTAAAGETGK